LQFAPSVNLQVSSGIKTRYSRQKYFIRSRELISNDYRVLMRNSTSISMAVSSNAQSGANQSASGLALSAFHTHARDLQRFLLRRVGDRNDADDLSQEVFARLMRVENVELVRHPLAYLLGIASHVVREFRHRKQHVIFDSDMAESLAENVELIPRGITNDSEQVELQNWLDDALRQLPATHQVVLLLVKRDGHSYEEAAAKTGLSVHTIEKYLVEARARLRVIMKDL
jgi:RNA polymerase sigma factor (sigma-70 family)